MQIELATIHAIDDAYLTLATTLCGEVPNPETDPVRCLSIWAQLEAAASQRAQEALAQTPAHLIDWNRIADAVGTTPADAKACYQPAQPATGNYQF